MKFIEFVVYNGKLAGKRIVVNTNAITHIEENDDLHVDVYISTRSEPFTVNGSVVDVVKLINN